VVEANYLDNPFFPQVLEIDRAWDQNRDPDKYSHVWGGGYIKRTGATVFKNWRVEDFETPSAVKSFMFGADFGYSIDPSCMNRMWLRDSRTLMIDYEAYRVGCEIEDTPALFDRVGCSLCAYDAPCPAAMHDLDQREGRITCSLCSSGRRCPLLYSEAGHAMARDWTVTADSSRPETISYLRRHGYRKIKGSKKGPNSVYEGVVFLKNLNIIVHPRCKHTADELTFYSWKIDPRTEQVTNLLSEKKNHVIDDLRYAVEDMRRPKAKVFERTTPDVPSVDSVQVKRTIVRSARVF
jgi:phage terminase large subunit